MTPTQIVLSAVLVASVGFGTGWTANGWRLSEQIANIKQQHAEEQSLQTLATLDEIQKASKNIQTAAIGAQAEISQVAQKLSAINRRFKDEKPKPLPSDCVPDPVRVRYLRDATETYNQAIIGPQLGR